MSQKRFNPNEGYRYASDNDFYYGLIVRTELKQSAVSVSNTVITKIPASPLSKRVSVLIYNNSTNIVYIGGEDVATSDGLPLLPRATIRFDIESGVDIYGIAETGASEVRIIEGV